MLCEGSDSPPVIPLMLYFSFGAGACDIPWESRKGGEGLCLTRVHCPVAHTPFVPLVSTAAPGVRVAFGSLSAVLTPDLLETGPGCNSWVFLAKFWFQTV